MSQRKIWTNQEDQILKIIMETKKNQKWSEIAKIMQETYSIFGRSGKQCRQRWHNQLDPNIKNQLWTEDQQKTLFLYHNEFGNRWAKIAQMIPGRTDNCIKNHFYCTLRKSIRKINRYINEHKNKIKFRQIKNSTLSKIVAVSQEKFERKLQVPQILINKCCEIKNKLIQYSKQVDITQQTQSDVKELINSIMDFNKSYKRKKNRKKKKSQLQDSSSSDNQFKLDQFQNKKCNIEVEKKIENNSYTNLQHQKKQVKKEFFIKIEESQKIQFQCFPPFQIQSLSPPRFSPELIPMKHFNQNPFNDQFLEQFREETHFYKETKNSPFRPNYLFRRQLEENSP